MVCFINNCMQKYILSILLISLFSCNKIETNKTLNQNDIEYIKSLKLLDENETILKFYSQNTKKTAGNFFTNKRVASYWIDARNFQKNEANFAFYNDIIKIDTVNIPGATYCSYALITKKDKNTFKVYVNGKKPEIKSFFQDLLIQWKKSKKTN